MGADLDASLGDGDGLLLHGLVDRNLARQPAAQHELRPASSGQTTNRPPSTLAQHRWAKCRRISAV